MHAIREKGTALTEALIAVLLISGGMFSNLRMLTEATAQLNTSLLQQRALELNSSFSEILTQLPPGTFAAHIDPSLHNCNITAACEPAELSADSLYRWHSAIAQDLPQGTGEIQLRNSAGVTTLELRISWQSPGGEATSFSSYALLLPL